jgi:hypothetical protein
MKNSLLSKKGIKKITITMILCIYVTSFTSAMLINDEIISGSDSITSDVLTLTSLNRQVRSINKFGTTYILEVKNNSAVEINATVSVENHNTEIENPDESSITKNVELKFSIHLVDQQTQLENIKIKPEGSIQFEVTVTVPENTPIEKWNCAKIEIVPNEPSLSPVQLMLHTFIPDITED